MLLTQTIGKHWLYVDQVKWRGTRAKTRRMVGSKSDDEEGDQGRAKEDEKAGRQLRRDYDEKFTL